MKIFLDTFTRGDYLLLAFIFGLDHRKIYAKVRSLVSKRLWDKTEYIS